MRNYKKEREWAKNKYDEIRFKVPKERGEEFRAKLDEDGIKLAEWGKKMIDEYLKKDAHN